MSVAVAAIVVIVAVALASWLLARRRRNVWRQLARRRRLVFLDAAEGPRVAGQADGRQVEIAVKDGGSDTVPGGVEVVEMTIDLNGIPHKLTAQGTPGLNSELAALGEDHLRTGSDAFDRIVLVQADDRERALAYWNEVRRQTFLDLIESSKCDQIAIRDGRLAAEWRSMVSVREQLEALLDSLLNAARRLDGNTRTQAL